MKEVTIHIYTKEPTQSTDQRVLTDVIIVPVESNKRLTAGRALKILGRTFPRFLNKIVIETEQGWEASRTIKPSEKYPKHYYWEYAVVLKSNE